MEQLKGLLYDSSLCIKQLVKTVMPREGLLIWPSWRQDLNLQPDDYKAPALPIAPRQQMGGANHPDLHRDTF